MHQKGAVQREFVSAQRSRYRVPSGTMLPNRLVTLTMLRRGVAIWLVTRIAASGVFAYAGKDPLRLDTGGLLTVVLLCTALCYVEMARNRERDLLANMGIRRRSLALLFIAAAVTGEGAVRAAAVWL